MKPLLNTLYITQPDVHLHYSNDNIVIKKNNDIVQAIPLHTIEQICTFNYTGATPTLMYECTKRHIPLIFHTPNGKFLAKVNGPTSGNILVRKQQFKIVEEQVASLELAKQIIIAKIHNQQFFLRQTLKNETNLPVKLHRQLSIKKIQTLKQQVLQVDSLQELFGIEGASSATYFANFPSLLKSPDPLLNFNMRSTRPPKDCMNVLLSFGYTLLKNDCISALEANGLDPFVGFLHQVKPGKPSLALDLQEPLRPLVDRFVIKLVNKKMIQSSHFNREEDSIHFTDEGRKKFLYYWQQEKKEKILYCANTGYVAQGLLPHLQAQQLNRFMRKEIDNFTPYIWRY